MPLPKAVKISGQEINEVQNVEISISTPVGPRGDYEGRTHSAIVRLVRRARNTPTVELFRKSTNEDGRLEIIDGEIVLQNSELKETYNFKMEEAYISEWEFTQPEEDDMLYEIVTLRVGKMTLSGGGDSKSFYVPEFNKHS